MDTIMDPRSELKAHSCYVTALLPWSLLLSFSKLLISTILIYTYIYKRKKNILKENDFVMFYHSNEFK